MITETNCTDFLETPITLLMKRGVLLLITFYYTYSTSFFLFYTVLYTCCFVVGGASDTQAPTAAFSVLKKNFHAFILPW